MEKVKMTIVEKIEKELSKELEKSLKDVDFCSLVKRCKLPKDVVLKNNTKLKVRFLVGSSSLLLLVIGVTTYFATYSDLILEFNDDPDYVESSVKDNKVIINEVESDYEGTVVDILVENGEMVEYGQPLVVIQ